MKPKKISSMQVDRHWRAYIGLREAYLLQKGWSMTSVGLLNLWTKRVKGQRLQLNGSDAFVTQHALDVGL